MILIKANNSKGDPSQSICTALGITVYCAIDLLILQTIATQTLHLNIFQLFNYTSQIYREFVKLGNHLTQ